MGSCSALEMREGEEEEVVSVVNKQDSVQPASPVFRHDRVTHEKKKK